MGIRDIEDGAQSPFRRSPWHIYPPEMKPQDWLVPYSGENAVIHHGHSSPDDHSLCGPVVFCCANSQQLFLEAFPDSAEAQASWEFTSSSHITSWIDAGVALLYFVFCDPVRPRGLLAGGLSGDEARQVLNKEVLLEQFGSRATRLR